MARFTNSDRADAAKEAVTRILNDAKKEVDALFALQDGLADMSDVSRIYARYGFVNESGWEQTRPLQCRKDELLWELPEGMRADEAEGLLAAFGAVSVNIEDPFDDELLRQVPHPAALILSETEDDPEDLDDLELVGIALYEKKILH
jgi:hypothetical protein